MSFEAGLVSCIVPAFNGERYIAETLCSILGQTYSFLEVIVVDDGSTDRTREIVAEFGTRVKYLYQTNAGTATARNSGLAAARGAFIAFLDADDLWHEAKLERQIALFEERPELDYCVAHVQNFWEPELAEEARRFSNHRRAGAIPGYTMPALLSRRQLFDAIGFFDTTLGHCDDTEWFLRAREWGAISALHPDVLMFRRMHLANRSRLLADRSLDEYFSLIKRRLDLRRLRDGLSPPHDTSPAPTAGD